MEYEKVAIDGDELTIKKFVEDWLNDDPARRAARATSLSFLLPSALNQEIKDEASESAQSGQAYLAFDRLSRNLVDRCTQEVRPWNRNVYGAGAAIYHTTTSLLPAAAPGMMAMVRMADDLGDVTGFGAWASAAVKSPLTPKTGQFTFHGRYTDNLVRERGTGDEKIVERVDGWSAAARYTHQFSASKDQKRRNARAVRGFIEAAYTEEEFGNITDEFWQAGIGAEIQVRKDMFFQFVVGDTFGSEIDRSTYLSGQFKWSFSKLPAQ